MKGPGAIALAVMGLCAPLVAQGGPTRRAAHSSIANRHEVTSPDRQQVAVVTRRGRVKVNGRLVRSGQGQALGQPVWRRDSRAVAFLQRSRHGMQLVVLPELDPRHPLVWQLPSTASRLRRVFWISAKQLGIGAREMVPRLVVSWSTPAANLPLW